MNDRALKLAKAKSLKRSGNLQLEFVQSSEIYKQLDTVYSKLEDVAKQNKELVKDATDIIGELLGELNEGVNIKNVDDITVNVEAPVIPEIKVPEVKMPTVNVPEPTVIQEQGLFSKYTPADIVKDGSTTYYGYLSKSGEWAIMRETTTKNTTKYRFSSGKDNFSKAFSNRAKLDYKYLDEVAL